MRKISLALLLSFSFALFACKDSKTETDTKTSNSEASLADSLEDQVWDAHDVGMAKYGPLRGMKLKAEQMIDSISRLPEAEKAAAAFYREQLSSLVTELSNAKEGMDSWMRYYRDVRDSAKDDPPQRIAFLRDEIERVNKVRDAILQSLARADSLIK